MDNEDFYNEFSTINWDDVIELNNNDTNLSFDSFFVNLLHS